MIPLRFGISLLFHEQNREFLKNENLYFQVINYSSNLAIFISNSNVGTYSCHVSVEGYDSIEVSATVYQHGPPVIIVHQPEISEYLEDTVELVCEVVSIPAPSIEWRYSNYIITSGIEHYTMIPHTLDKAKVVSTLIIKESVQSDYEDYNCSARNSYGQDTAILYLVRKNSSMVLVWLMLFLMFLVLSILLVIITSLVLSHRRSYMLDTCLDHSKDKTGTNIKREEAKSYNISEYEVQTKEESENNSKTLRQVNQNKKL